MRKLLLSAASFLALAACGSGPRLEFPDPYHDFGALYAGDTAEHFFEFQNAGGEDAVIKSVQSSCGCTVAEIWVEEKGGAIRRGEMTRLGEVLIVHPGEKGRIQISLSTKNLNVDVAQKSGTVAITTNEKGKEYTNLQYAAKIERPYQLERDRFDFGAIGRKESKIFSTRVASLGPADFQIAKILPSHPALHAEILKEDSEGRPLYTVEIEAGPDLPEGVFNGKVDLVTNLRGGHTISIPVYGIVTGDIVTQPLYFHFPFIKKGSEGSCSLEVRCTDPGRKIRLGSIAIEGSDAAMFSAAVKEIEEGKRFEITLRSSKDLATPVFRGNVKVETDHPEKPLLEIPYRGFVR